MKIEFSYPKFIYNAFINFIVTVIRFLSCKCSGKNIFESETVKSSWKWKTDKTIERKSVCIQTDSNGSSISPINLHTVGVDFENVSNKSVSYVHDLGEIFLKVTGGERINEKTNVSNQTLV